MSNSNNTFNNQPLPAVKVQQFINNIRVIEELAKEQPDIELLKTYKGFGGLKKCFWERNLYGQLMRAIRANFGVEQEKTILEIARNTCSSAYYTPKPIIEFMYKYLTQVCGFSGGEILEPACGNGAFFEYMPEEIKTNSEIRAIECDMLTAKLTKKIYPHVKMVYDKFEDYESEKKFDLIIGNPPYTAEKVIDANMQDISGYTIHNYFIAKSVRLLKDNGLLAFVMPSFFMDKPKKCTTRHIIDNEAVVIDVVRLPDNLFEQAKVTVDLVFIRKTGNKIHDIMDTVEFVQGKACDEVNKFWLTHPNRILGELKLKWVECYKNYIPTCQTQNKEQALKYLSVCDFKQETIENYAQIVGATNKNSQNNKIANFVSHLTALKDSLGKVADSVMDDSNEIDNIKSYIVDLAKSVDRNRKMLSDIYDDFAQLLEEISD